MRAAAPRKPHLRPRRVRDASTSPINNASDTLKFMMRRWKIDSKNRFAFSIASHWDGTRLSSAARPARLFSITELQNKAKTSSGDAEVFSFDSKTICILEQNELIVFDSFALSRTKSKISVLLAWLSTSRSRCMISVIGR